MVKSDFALLATACQLLRMIFKVIKVCIFLCFVKNNNLIVVYERVPDDDWAIKTYVADRKCFRTMVNESLTDGEVFFARLLEYKSVLESFFKVLKANYSAFGDIPKDILERDVPISLKTDLIKAHLLKKFSWNNTHVKKLAKILRDLIKAHQDCCTITLRIGYRM